MFKHGDSSNTLNMSVAFTTKFKLLFFVKVTHGEKAHSNKIPALTKSMNMDIWVVSLTNQLFIRGLYTEIKFRKK